MPLFNNNTKNNSNNTSNPKNNNNNDNDNTHTNTNKIVKKMFLNDERLIFGDFYGIINNKYVKYFNLLCFHLFSTIVFGFIYYFLLLDFDRFFFIPAEFPKDPFLNIALRRDILCGSQTSS